MDIQPGPSKRPFRSIKVLWAGGFLCLVLLLLMRSTLADRWAQQILQSALQEQAYLHLSFSRFHVSILPISLSFHDVQLLYDSPKASSPMLQAKEITLRASLLALLLDSREKFSLVTQDLKLHTDRPPDLPTLRKSSPSTPPVALRFSEIDKLIRRSPLSAIELRNTTLFFSVPFDEKNPQEPVYLRFALEGVDLAFHTHEDEPKGHVQIRSFSLTRENIPIVTRAALTTNVRYEMGSFLFSEVLSQGDSVQLSAHTSLSLLSVEDAYVGMEVLTQGKVVTPFSFLGGLLDIPKTAGTAQADVNMRIFAPTTGELEFSLSGNATLQNATLAGYKLFDSTGEFVITLDGISLSRLRVLQAGTCLATGEGYIGFSDKVAYRFTGQPEKLGFIQLLDALQVPFSAVDFSIGKGEFRLSGAAAPFHMEIGAKVPLSRVRMEGLRDTKSPFPEPICQANVAISVASDSLRIHDSPLVCTLQSGPASIQSTIRTNGFLDFSQERLTLQFQSKDANFQLAQPTFQIPLTGVGRIQTLIEGPYKRITVKNDFSLQQVHVQDISLGAVAGRAEIQGAHVTWGPLQIASETGMKVTSSQGSLHFDTEQYAFMGDITGVKPGFVQQLVAATSSKTPFSFGLRSFSGHVQGSWRDFFQLQGAGTVDLSTLSHANTPVFSSLGFNFEGKNRTIRMEKIQAITRNQQVAGTLSVTRPQVGSRDSKNVYPLPWLPLYATDKLDVALHSEGVKESVTGSDTLPLLSDFFPNLQAKGDLQLVMQLTGTPKALQGEIELMGSHLSVQKRALSPFRLKGFIRDSALDTHVEYGGNALQGRFLLDLRDPAMPYQAFSHFENVDLRFLFPPAYTTNPRSYFYFTGNSQLSGSLLDIWRSSGFFSLSQAHHAIAYATHLVDLHLATPSTLLVTKGRVTYKDNIPMQVVGDALQTTLEIERVDLPHAIEVSVQSQVTLALFSQLYPEIEAASGYASFEAKIWGGVEDLHYQVEAKSIPMWKGIYTPVSVTLSKAPPRLDDIEFHAIVMDGILDIQNLRMRKGDGWIRAKGSFNPTPDFATESSLSISLEKARFILPTPYVKNLDLELSGALHVSSREGKHFVSGALQMPKCNSNRNFNLREEILSAIQSEKTAAWQDAKELIESVYYDISLHSDRTIKIQSKDMSLQASADLKLGGNNLKPQLIGEVNIDRGKFYYKKEFTVIRGHAAFDNPSQIDPRITVLAQATIGSYQVGVEAEGPLSDMNMRVFTDPLLREDGSPISQLDALVLLSTGKLPDPDRQSIQSGGVGVSEALNVYTSQLPFAQMDEVLGQKYINFYIDTTTDDNGSPVLRLNIPIVVLDGIDAVIRTTQTKKEFSAEAPLDDSVSVSGNVSMNQTNDEKTKEDNQAQQSLAVKFKLSFK